MAKESMVREGVEVTEENAEQIWASNKWSPHHNPWTDDVDKEDETAATGLL